MTIRVEQASNGYYCTTMAYGSRVCLTLEEVFEFMKETFISRPEPAKDNTNVDKPCVFHPNDALGYCRTHNNICKTGG